MTVKKTIRRLVSVVLSASLLSVSAFSPVYASGNTSGRYSYTSNEGSNKQRTDSFVYNDSYFTASSFTENIELRLLSTQAAIASGSRYGDAEDKYEQDPTYNAKNVLDMLKAMGFQNVKANEWYSHEKQENSFGVAIGSRQIVQGEKTYTLLAIFPRSAGYKQEWVGNFNVGKGDIHEGFKAARDEALRFSKKYIQDNNITGDLKVWIAGHSRGAAVSNLIGGFFAGGGIGYFGDDVSITSEDVYCYTFATPKNIKNGSSKDAVLSVAGARSEDEVYRYDTAQEEYVYSSGGTITIDAEMFNGIRNYPFAYDFITYLPPSVWGFSNYGQYCDFGSVTEAQMRNELKNLNEPIYDEYDKGGSPLEFHEKTLDVANFTTKDVEDGLSGQDGMVDFLKARIKGFATTFPTNQKYFDDYQVTMQSYIALYGMASGEIKEVEGLTGMLAKPLIMAYLSYASKCMYGENPTVEQENEAAAIALKELLDIMLEKQPPIDLATYTVDNFFADFTKYVADNEGSELSKKIIDLVESQVPKDYASTAKSLLGSYCPNYSDQTPLGEVVFAFIKACARGVDPNATIYDTQDASKNAPGEVRKTLYGFVAMMSMLGVLKSDLSAAINYGNGKFTDLVAAILKIFKQDVTNPDSKPTSSEVAPAYATLDEAATGELREALSKIRTQVNTSMTDNDRYTTEFRGQVDTHFEQAIACVPKIRECAMNLLFAHDGGFSTDYNLRSLATLIGNAGRIPPAHYNETFVAWAKAAIPTYALTVNKGTGSGSYAEGASVTITANAPASGKKFKEWTGADGLIFTSGSASTAAATFTMPAKAVTLTAVYRNSSTGGSSGSGGGTTPPKPDPTPGPESYTIPVTNETSVQVETKITDGNAVVSEITKEEIEKITKPASGEEEPVNTLTIDLSGAKQTVDSVELTKGTVEALAKAVADDTNNVKTVTIRIQDAVVELDASALKAIAEQSGGKTVKLAVDKGYKKTALNKKQQEAIGDYKEAVIFEAYFEADGTRIHDLNGGTAKVSIQYDLPEDLLPEFVQMLYLDPTGNVEKLLTTYEDGWATGILTHCSEYAIVYDESNAADDQGAVEIYRLYNPYSGEHLFTGNVGERDILITLGWSYEDIAWYSPEYSKEPVFRLYNPYSGDHHYTMNAGERDILIGLGWNDEGIGWYSEESEAVPVFRLFNPYALMTGAHHFTVKEGERDILVKLGWNDEGIGWYGIDME